MTPIQTTPIAIALVVCLAPSGVTAQDVFEPNDSFLEATPIAPDELPQTHTFHTEFDEDWFVFQAGAPGSFLFETKNLAPSTDTLVEFYNPGQSLPGPLFKVEEDRTAGSAIEVVTIVDIDHQLCYVRVRPSPISRLPHEFGPSASYEATLISVLNVCLFEAHVLNSRT